MADLGLFGFGSLRICSRRALCTHMWMSKASVQPLGCREQGGSLEACWGPGLWCSSCTFLAQVGKSPSLSFLCRIPGSKKSPEGPVSRVASTLPSRPSVIPDHPKKSPGNGVVSSPLMAKVLCKWKSWPGGPAHCCFERFRGPGVSSGDLAMVGGTCRLWRCTNRIIP